MRVDSGRIRKTRKRILSFVISLIMLLTMMMAGGGTALAEDEVFAGGDGSSGNPYQIINAAQLNAVRNDLSAHYALASDIDLAPYLSAGGDGYNAGAGWLPIGDWDNIYSGTFNGAGHTINGLAINRETDLNGLFGVIGPTGVIRDLGLTGVSVESSSGYNGSLAGCNYGIIDNCSAAGAVSGVYITGGLVGGTGEYNTGVGGGDIINSHAAVAVTGNGEDTGGLVGGVYYGDIMDSYATGSVSGRSNSGGLVGNSYEGSISGCHATGNVTAAVIYDGVNLTSGLRVGGLVGDNVGSITSSYATGDVSGAGDVGGLVGKNSGSISDCYATGAVTGTIYSVGGLVGEGGNISQCYAAGAVTGSADVGGLVGLKFGDVLSSFYSETTGQTDTGGVRKTTIEMKQQVTYTDWNFTAVTGMWRISEGYTYPVLQWQPQTTEEINAMISMDRAALAIAYAAGDSEGNVTQNLTLPTAGAQGTFISWSSSNTAAVANDGTVTRPSTANSAVTLTATVSLTGGTSQTRDFGLTVIERPAGIVSTLPATLTEAAANDGSLASGAVVITIANGTLTAGIAKADITAANLPEGLSYTVSRTDGTHLTISITGNAVNHTNVNDVGNLTFTIAQASINRAEGDQTTGIISIDFNDPAVTYSITYHANGGTGTAPTETNKAAGASFNATANTFTPPSGKQFKEWNTAAGGTGTTYLAGATVTMPANTLNLYAIWENAPVANSCLEIIFLEGGDVKLNNVSVINTYSVQHPMDMDVRLEAVPNEGYTFAYWTNNDTDSIISTNPVYQRILGAGINVKAVFTKIATEGDTIFTVTFKDKSGRILQSDGVLKGGTATPPDEPAIVGYSFKEWCPAYGNVTSNLVITAIYERLPATYTVTVEGGTLSTGGTEGAYHFDMPVMVVAGTAPAGQKFSHWTLDNVKVSTKSTFSLFAPMRNTILKAVFVDVGIPLNNVPFITISDHIMIDTNNKTMMFTAIKNVPDGYTLVECGVMLVKSNVPLAGDLTMDTPDAIRAKSNNLTNDQFYVRKINITPGDTWYARAYLIYKDSNGNTVTVYSDTTVSQTMGGE